MTEQLELQNDELHVVIAPAEGGRVVSLKSLASGLEFLYQSQHAFSPVSPSRTANFQQGPCAGIEECLPTVARCKFKGEVIPDHGDFWQLPWRVVPASGANAICLTADGFSQPLRFTKQLSLRGSCLRIDYQVQNIGTEAVSFHYATHPLLAVEAGDRILLPSGVAQLTLNGSRSNRLGEPGQQVPWPLLPQAEGTTPINLSHIRDVDAGTAEMLYSGKLTEGWCGLYRAQHQQGIVLKFSVAELPYLGLWICSGGWPEQAGNVKQFAFAPEPTTAPCPSLEAAHASGLAMCLPPAQIFRFHLDFCVSSVNCSSDNFYELAVRI